MSTNARHLKAHVHKKGHFCGIRRDPILWSKDQRRKKLSKKWFHGSKKDQKKLSNETQIRQHKNIIIGVERQKKSWHNDFLPKFYLKENAFIWKQKSVGPDLLATSFSRKNRPQNPTCCWLSLTWYTINCMEQILYSSALTTLAMLRHTIPLLLSTRNGSKSSRSTIKFH